MNFQEQQNRFYDSVADDSTSETYPLGNVKAAINAGEAAFIDEKVRWSFLEADLLLTTVADTTIGTAYAAGDTSLVLDDASTYPTASSTSYGIWIEGDILETWTGKSTNTLTTITGLQVAHAAAVNVKPLYKLPSTINKPVKIYVDGDQLDYTPYEQWTGADNTFTIYQDYIFLPENDGGEILRIPYYKSPVELVDDSDTSLLPASYHLAPVYYALGKMLLDTDEISKARSYCYFNPQTKKYEGLFGEMLYRAKKLDSTKVENNHRRIKVAKRLRSR